MFDMSNKRAYGASGAEPRGKIKTKILVYVYDSKTSVSRDDIADYIIDWSRNNLKIPIRQRQGIYRHVLELSKEQKLIKKDKINNTYYYSPLDLTLHNFREVCKYSLKNDNFSILMDSHYFKEKLALFLNDLLKEAFDIDISTIHNKSSSFKLLKDLIIKSPTASRFLILEPKKLEEACYIMELYPGVRPRKLSKEENIYNTIFMLASTSDKHNTKFKLEKINSKKAREEAENVFKSLFEIMPRLIMCYYIDLSQELLRINYEDFVNNKDIKKLKKLYKNLKDFEDKAGFYSMIEPYDKAREYYDF